MKSKERETLQSALYTALCRASMCCDCYNHCFYLSFPFFGLGLYSLWLINYHIFNIFNVKDRTVLYFFSCQVFKTIDNLNFTGRDSLCIFLIKTFVVFLPQL